MSGASEGPYDDSHDETFADPAGSDRADEGHAPEHDFVDPALAATLAAGAAWLAGKGIHRLRKRRHATKGAPRTRTGGKVSNIVWTALAAVTAAIVEAVVSRVIRRSRGR